MHQSDNNNLTIPRVIALRFKKDNQLVEDILQQVRTNIYYHIDFCSCWGQFSDTLTQETNLILFHCKILDNHVISPNEIYDLISSMSRFTIGKQINIAAVIDNDTTYARIKELRKLDIRGVVPSSEFWGAEVGALAVVSILSGNQYWPKDIIDQLPGAVKKVKTNTQGIRLTARQLEVMELVCKRGLSNKGVAKMLKISESTVKIHVSAVMKAYGVRNRTQLALTASSNFKV